MKQKLKFLTKKVVIAGLMFLMIFSVTSAATTDDLQQNIDEKQQQLDEITNEIQNLQREINKRRNEVASLQNEVAIFDLQIQQTESQIQAVQLEIDKLNDEIASIKIEIKAKEEELQKQKTYLAETLRLISEYDSYGPLELSLSGGTFSELLDQAQYANNLQEKSQDIMNEVRTLKDQLEKKQSELQDKVTEQEASKKQIKLSKQALEDQRNAKNSLLDATRGQEKLYQSLLNQSAQKQEEVSREIYNLEINLRQQLGDKTLPPITGALRWPASGILTQGYGNTGFTALGYNFHNGIDIAGPPGTKIYAAGDGIVYAMGTGKTAYGNWIVLKHTISKDSQVYNIYTLYGHLQGFNVAKGQVVRGGDLIGFMGNTGNTTRLLYGPDRGYHLHFSVFDEEGFGIAGGAHQDIYGPYEVPYGYTYNPMNFLK